MSSISTDLLRWPFRSVHWSIRIMGSTAGDSRRRRIAIPRRPSGTTRAPRIAGLFSIADVGSTQRPRGQRADGSPALRLFRLRSGLNCGKSARYRTNTTGCGRNKAWRQNLRCDGAYGCHLRLLRIIRTIRSVFFFHGLRFFRTIRVIIRILARLQGRPSFALLFLFFLRRLSHRRLQGSTLFWVPGSSLPASASSVTLQMLATRGPAISPSVPMI